MLLLGPRYSDKGYRHPGTVYSTEYIVEMKANAAKEQKDERRGSESGTESEVDDASTGEERRDSSEDGEEGRTVSRSGVSVLEDFERYPTPTIGC